MTEGNRRDRGKKRRRTCRHSSDTEQRPLSAVSQVCEQNGLQNMGTDDVRMYQLASADQMNRFVQNLNNNNNGARVDDIDTIHYKIQQEFSANKNVPRMEFYVRWPRHIIFHPMFVGVCANGFFVYLMMLSGMIAGGMAVYAVRYILEKMVYYLPSLLIYLIAAIVIICGTELLPPLTLVNGMESFVDRVKWCGIFMLVNYYILPYVSEVVELSCYNVVVLVSGIWHFDQGDLHHKKFTWYAKQREDYFLKEENVDIVIRNLCLNYFEVSAGIAMIYAGGIGIYTYKAFFIVWICIRSCLRNKKYPCPAAVTKLTNSSE